MDQERAAKLKPKDEVRITSGKNAAVVKTRWDEAAGVFWVTIFSAADGYECVPHCCLRNEAWSPAGEAAGEAEEGEGTDAGRAS